MCRPLQSIPAINARLDAVDFLSAHAELVEEFKQHLLQVRDLERLLGCVRNSSAAPSEGIPNWAIKAAQTRCDSHVQAGLLSADWIRPHFWLVPCGCVEPHLCSKLKASHMFGSQNSSLQAETVLCSKRGCTFPANFWSWTSSIDMLGMT